MQHIYLRTYSSTYALYFLYVSLSHTLMHVQHLRRLFSIKMEAYTSWRIFCLHMDLSTHTSHIHHTPSRWHISFTGLSCIFKPLQTWQKDDTRYYFSAVSFKNEQHTIIDQYNHLWGMFIINYNTCLEWPFTSYVNN